MNAAYVDSSCLVAIAMGEAEAGSVKRALLRCDRLFSSNLLEAELRAALAREEVVVSPDPLLARISWVLPDRPLTREFTEVLDAGYARGADLFHLATALLLDPSRRITFITLDGRQHEIARSLGFSVISRR